MGEEVAQHHKDIAPLLATSGNHRLQAGIYRCPMVGAKTAAHFLLDFSQAQVSFGLVVGKQDTLPRGKGQNISLMLCQSAQQITLRCAFRASPVRLGFGWRFCQCCLVQVQDLAIALPGGYGSLSARGRSLPVEVQRERYTSPLPIPNPAPPDHAAYAGHAPGTPHVSPR